MYPLDPYGQGVYMSPSGGLVNRKHTAAEWTSSNYILDAGEIGVELDTARFKMGDGVSGWNALGYFASEAAVILLINDAVAASAIDAAQAALAEHINSATPHPIYDDGPSLLLLYENAKV